MSSTPTSPVTPSSELHSLHIEDASSPTSPTSPTSPPLSKPLPPSHTRCILFTTALVIAAALLIGLLAGLLSRSSSSSSPSTYRAVAIQYLPYSSPSSASTLLSLNLRSYSSIVASLSPQSPDLIAFPEGGLGYLAADTGANATATRQALLPFCEPVPPPPSNPCLTLNATTSPQLTTLSCLARHYAASLVVELCQIEVCVPGSTPTPASTVYPFASSPCPSDGYYYWASNVVFSASGAIAAVYAKSHLFDTLSFNIPSPTSVTWRMGDVTFGTVVAFDIEFRQPLRALLEAGVQHFVWTGWWATNQPPQLTSVMIQAGWAARWGVNLIAANALTAVGYGGGVYSGGAVANTAFDPSYVAKEGEWRAVVQDLPRQLPPGPQPLVDPPVLGAVALPPALGAAQVPCVISAIGEGGNCTFLTPVPTQTVSAKHGDVTCVAVVGLGGGNLSAAVSGYALYASQNSYVAPETPSSLYLESCHLLYCASSQPSVAPLPCDSAAYDAPVAFQTVTLLAGFNCSRFGATVGEGGEGEEGDGPAGTVLPMMAVGRGKVVAGVGYEWGYAGKSGGQCWWNITVLQPIAQGLFSLGFYGTDGQADTVV